MADSYTIVTARSTYATLSTYPAFSAAADATEYNACAGTTNATARSTYAALSTYPAFSAAANAAEYNTCADTTNATACSVPTVSMAAATPDNSCLSPDT